MNKTVDVMKNIREEQLDRVIQSLVLIGIILLAVSLSRALFTGWHNFMFIHIGSYIVVLGIAFFRKHLSHVLKTWLLVIIIFILAAAGLAQLGLVGYGMGLLFIFCIISTIFFGTQGGIKAAILSALTIAVTGIFVVNGVITFDFDLARYIKSPATWLLGTVGMLLFTGLIVTILSKINNQLIELVQELNLHNSELREANKKLEDALEEQKRLKTGLEQAQKMELVGIIAGGVVHDLNNVLAASINYPELLLLNLPENSPMIKPLAAIKKSGLKAAAIVDDLLTLSRRKVAKSRVLNLNNIVLECITSPEIERIKAYHPNVNIVINLDEKLQNIEGYPLHLAKSLTNLISNASEAMARGGTIVIETANIFINENNSFQKEISAGAYSILKISDEGEGIAEEDKEKIFEPFFTKKEMGRSGTGLGMTVVWNTVKDHNGRIVLDSRKGKGTTFTLYFPVTGKQLPFEKEDFYIPIRTGSGESILVVDDVEEQREIARKILLNLGYTVTTRPSGEDAVEYIRSHNTDLVILDMIMHPGMDGLDTFKRILEMHPDQKAIISSGFSETDRLREAQRLGAEYI